MTDEEWNPVSLVKIYSLDRLPDPETFTKDLSA